MPFPFHLEAAGPMPFMPYPDIEKIQAVIIHILEPGPMTEAEIHATLFLASAHHYQLHGRPIVGETWMRGFGQYGVFGIVLSATLGGMKRRHELTHYKPKDADTVTNGLTHSATFNPEGILDLLSISDIEALAADRVVDATPADRSGTAALIKAERLYGSGADGTLINWMDGLPEEHINSLDVRSDVMHMLVHGT